MKKSSKSGSASALSSAAEPKKIIEAVLRLGKAAGAYETEVHFDETIEALTRALAIELAPIRVNAVSPGVVLEKVPGEVHRAEANMNGTPAGRIGRPQEIAHAAVYLASDESAFVHGIVLDVDGGRTTVARHRPVALEASSPTRQRRCGAAASAQIL